jgi:hypothetical protein
MMADKEEDDGRRLWQAAQEGRTVLREPPVHVSTRWATNALNIAIWNDHRETVSVLLLRFAALRLVHAQDRRGRTPLSCAAFHGSAGAAQSLIEANAAVNKADIYGRTPMSHAAQ